MSLFFRGLVALFSLGLIGLIGGVGIFVWVLFYYGGDLPDFEQLANYEPPIITRVHTSDGRLMAEFAEEKRIFLPLREIPDHVKQAFISAEDKNFYTHPGIDALGIARAIHTNIRNHGKRRPVGASTITQQVAKNFLLTNEVSYERKIKEMILSFRIERAFSKEQILELYLNEIYMGAGTYGVAAAALYYFGKTIDKVTIEEAAYLATLPKAPNNYHPTRHYDAAFERRNWVMSRMSEDGHIPPEDLPALQEKPLETVAQENEEIYTNASYFAEEVRRHLIETYGEDTLYKGGLVVHTSLIPELQKAASQALRHGLVAYDRRHGRHREHIAKMASLENWQQQLTEIQQPVGAEDWRLAVVLDSNKNRAQIGFSDGKKGTIPLENVTWARERLSSFSRGPEIKSVTQVLKPGDVILTEAADDKDGKIYHYRQIPEVQGALVAIDPHTGRVLAMVGGFSYEISEFNRATQAQRQPGSAFKPVVYTTALESGYTPATLVLDAPFVLDQGAGLGKWRPSNYSHEFYGPTPLRVGIEKSRNLMTVRLAHQLGMEKIAEMSHRLGIIEDLDPVLSMALGAGETTLLRMVRGYSSFVNGGKRIYPSIIDRIQDRTGHTIAKNDARPCEGCGPLIPWNTQDVPALPDIREQILDPRHAYQIVSIMEGTVQRGTAIRLKSMNRPMAGKTGTTNEAKDTWFIGYTPDLVVGVYIGFDTPRPMGREETGSRVSVPVFKEFMETALKDKPAVPFRVPQGIRLVQINRADGTRAEAGDEHVIWEAFLHGTEPSNRPVIFDGEKLVPIEAQDASSSVTTGTGGLY
ncbi:MAG: penicillin-binding protein 1A [Alphaproteobacteria bacterium]|nr:MAG: penicillin-binding protein 1A [Alphaproteobacteria bacterium]